MLNFLELIAALKKAKYLQLPFFNQSRDGELESHAILQIPFSYLHQIGLPIARDNSLFIAKKEEIFSFYEIDWKDYLGGGDDAHVYGGINVETGEKIAMAIFYSRRPPIGWKLAHEQLNNYSYFIKTYAYGLSYELFEEGVQAYVACLFMERAKSTVYKASKGFGNWTAKQSFEFIKSAAMAAVTLQEKSISGFDDHPGNYLIGFDDRLKLTDYTGLSSDDFAKLAHRIATNLIPVLYSRYSPISAILDKTGIHKIHDELNRDLDRFYEEGISLSHEALYDKIQQAVFACELHKCISQCEKNETVGILNIEGSCNATCSTDPLKTPTNTSWNGALASVVGHAALLGALRGSVGAMEVMLKKSKRVSGETVALLKEPIYYTALFLFYFFLQTQQKESSIGDKASYALENMLKIILIEKFSQGVSSIGERLKQNSWDRVGNGLKKCGNLLGQFGLFAYGVRNNGLAATAAAVITGAAVEESIKYTVVSG